jgi:hypothetical protein
MVVCFPKHSCSSYQFLSSTLLYRETIPSHFTAYGTTAVGAKLTLAGNIVPPGGEAPVTSTAPMSHLGAPALPQPVLWFP